MKILKIAAGVVLLLIIGVVAVLMTVDVSKYKGLIQDQAKAATGRDVTIGDIKLSISLSPAIVVSDVKVANAPWGSQPTMLSVKNIEAHTQLVPLLFGHVNINGLKLVEPDVVLETDAKGKGNWEFETASTPASPPSASKSAAPPLTISGVSVEGLKLAYHDGKTNGGAAITAKSADLSMDGALADLRIQSITLNDAAGSYTQGAMTGQGSVAKFDLAATGAITDFNITKLVLTDAKGSYKDGASTYEGAVANFAMEGEGAARPPVKAGGRIDVVAALRALDISSLTVEKASGSLKDAKTTASGAVGKVSVSAKGPIGSLGISNIAVSDSKVSYKGEGAPLEAEIATWSLDGGGALNLAAKVGGKDVKANGTLASVAALASKSKSFPVKVSLEGYGLKGDTDLMIDMSGKRPAVKGTVTIPDLDLASLEKSAAGPGGSAGPSAKADGRVFSDEPLPWDSLASTEANVKVSVAKATLPNGLVLTNLVIPVELVAGKLAVKGASFAVAGGTINTDLNADAADKSLVLKTEAKGVTAETLAKEMKSGDLITQGPLDLDMNVRGAGNSAHAVMASLNGSVIAGMGESKIRNDALNIIGADVVMQVLSAINPVGNKDPYTVARCAVVNLQIAGGVATTNNGIALVTDKMQVTSSGTVNFGTERVDLSVRPKATGGLGVGLGSLLQSLKVSGPLSAPGIGIDKAGAAKALSALGAAFATGGLSALAQGAKDRADTSSAGDPCQVARTWQIKK